MNDRSEDDFAATYGRLLVDLVEPGGVLFVYGDSDTGPVGYLQVVEGVRPDVNVYNVQGLVFAKRLLPALSSPARRESALRTYLSEHRGAVYHTAEKIVPPVRTTTTA